MIDDRVGRTPSLFTISKYQTRCEAGAIVYRRRERAMFDKFVLTAQMMSYSILAGLLSLGICAVASSAEISNSAQRFAAREMTPAVAGRLSQVMVLGSIHLGQNAELRSLVASKENLQPLLDRLAAFKPELITIEALSGRDCDQLMRYTKSIPQVYEKYCRKTDAAKNATGLSVEDATSSVISVLRTWPTASRGALSRCQRPLFGFGSMAAASKERAQNRG